jgi:predicted O-methyltransferase YrrM
MLNIEKALQIEGWMEPPEIAWLAEQAASHRLIVEIGSYKGRSTRALADNTDGLVIAIDDFIGPREIEVANRDLIYEQFQRNTAGCNNIVVIKANHRELPEPEFQPDFVFIDGAHEYEAVKADIQYWLPRIAKDGIISGHDYTWFEEIRIAVRELLPTAEVAPGTSIWFQTV